MDVKAFKNAVQRMCEDGEFTRIAAWYETERNDGAAAEHVREIEAAVDDAHGIPFPALLLMMDDAAVLQSAICYAIPAMCRNVHPRKADDGNNGGIVFKCGECGLEVEADMIEAGYQDGCTALFFSYCPCCGAKVDG